MRNIAIYVLVEKKYTVLSSGFCFTPTLLHQEGSLNKNTKPIYDCLGVI